MASWECLDCTSVYSVGAPACPECRSTNHIEQGAEPSKKAPESTKAKAATP